jgi:hypothetical protein
VAADHAFVPGDIVRIIHVSEARHTLVRHLYRYAVVKEMDPAEAHRMMCSYGYPRYMLVRIDGAGFDILIEPEWLEKVDARAITLEPHTIAQAFQVVYDKIVDRLAAEDTQNPYMRLIKELREAA